MAKKHYLGRNARITFGSAYDPKAKATHRADAVGASKAEKATMDEMIYKTFHFESAPQGDSKGNAYLRKELQRAMMEQITKHGSGSLFGGGWPSPDFLEEEGSVEYRQARRAVEAWLTQADANSFDDIVGNDDALAQLRDAITGPVEHADLYKAYGMKAPKGALLYGPPGCGKTMFARAAATEMRRLYGDNVEFLSLAATELQSGYVGQTEQRIKAIFTFAREYQKKNGHPLLVFIDEAEALLPDRNGRGRRVQPWEESQVAMFLAEMDGIRESGAFVLLATNRPEAIDQAVLRDGRCDFKIAVKRPNAVAIERILMRAFGKESLLRDSAKDLAFAALEGLMDPNKIIHEGHLISMGPNQTVKDNGGTAFLLEHIVSGAMVASIPARAKRNAFIRDKALGIVSGLTVKDVIKAVNDLFIENKGLDHSFALQEFVKETLEKVETKGRVLQ